MMVMAAKSMEIAGKLEPAVAPEVLGSFSDRFKIASYAVDSTAALVSSGLIKGSDNRVNPLANSTRAEIAVFLYRVYNK